jgi:UDP-glucose-4-epimerase GalE
VELLCGAGREVVVVDNLSRGHRGAIPPEVPFYAGDVGDRAVIERLAAEHDLEACIHFAALTYVGESVQEPARYYRNNVAQSIALFEGLVEAGVRRLVFSSTCATYGEPERTPLDEAHPQRPQNPYGWGKYFVERILESFEAAYGFRFVALRYFNASGATARCGEDHDPETHLIPICLEVALGKRPHLSVFGDDYPTADGTPVRDYIHVADLGSAHVLALDHLAAGGDSDFLNLGTGTGYSVLEVVDTVRQVTGRAVNVKIAGRREGDASHLVAQAERAHRVLGWEPAQADLVGIVSSAWEWHQNHPDGYGGGDRRRHGD